MPQSNQPVLQNAKNAREYNVQEDFERQSGQESFGDGTLEKKHRIRTRPIIFDLTGNSAPSNNRR